MKYLFMLFVLTFCNSMYAQPLLSEFNKVREIKMLESTREDIRKILADFERDSEDNEDYEPYFSTKNVEVRITLASGDCSEGSEKWNVPEWTVRKIKIIPEDEAKIRVRDFNFDFSKYKKETEEDNLPGFYTYHSEDEGIIFEITNDEIEEIIIYPPKSKIAFLCNNEETSEILSGERPFTSLIYEPIYCPPPASVANLTLSANEIISCNKSAKNKKCAESVAKISVMTESNEPENAQLVYNYIVSAGKIIGTGNNVIWDLSGTAPGTYTITAGVDDGCGICGETKTQSVKVK